VNGTACGRQPIAQFQRLHRLVENAYLSLLAASAAERTSLSKMLALRARCTFRPVRGASKDNVRHSASWRGHETGYLTRINIA
jgi:hypothetical protein